MADEGEQKSGLKKVAQYEFWKSGPARLYLDDIEEVYGLFRRVAESVKLRLDGYEVPTLADIKLVKATETWDFEVNLTHPHSYVAFETYGNGFRYYMADRDDLELVGLRDAVKGVVQKRRLWAPGFWRVNVVWWVFIVASWAVNWLPLNHAQQLYAVLLTAGGLIIFGTAGFIGIRNEVYRGGRVVLHHSDSKPSFRQSNRDLLLVLLGGAITLAATVIAELLVRAIH
jgi:hypothetical protein